MLDDLRWDSELIRRYDLAGPRYTSYPTAVQFHTQTGAFDLLHALRESRKALRPLSLYVHIPFCANICYYCACNKVITKDRGRAQAYLQRLEHEIEMIACHVDARQVVEQLHLGGGTPTFLSHVELRQLMAHLRKHFHLLDDHSADYGIEIDPREADWSTMGLLRELGFNRVSLGVQDLDPLVQRAINRLQSLEETRAIVEAARTLQFRSVNVDLIYGLPLQTPDGFARTVDEVIATVRMARERGLAVRPIGAGHSFTAAAMTDVEGTDYGDGLLYSRLYPAAGTWVDHAYGTHGSTSLLLELRDRGAYGFLLPAEQLLPTAMEAWAAVRVLLEHPPVRLGVAATETAGGDLRVRVRRVGDGPDGQPETEVWLGASVDGPGTTVTGLGPDLELANAAVHGPYPVGERGEAVAVFPAGTVDEGTLWQAFTASARSRPTPE